MTRYVTLNFGESFQLAPGIVIKSKGMHGSAASIAVDAPRHVPVVKAESMDPDVIAYRKALIGGVA